MLGLRTSPRDGGEERQGLRVINETLDELYFSIEHRAGHGAVSVGANFNNTPPQAPVVEFPVAGVWRIIERRRPRWQRCGLRWRIYYTSDGAAGGNYSLTMNTVMLDAGDTLGVPVATLLTTMALPAPAAANDIMVFEGIDASPLIIPGSKPLVRFALLRNVGNANLLRILSVHYDLLPG